MSILSQFSNGGGGGIIWQRLILKLKVFIAPFTGTYNIAAIGGRGSGGKGKAYGLATGGAFFDRFNEYKYAILSSTGVNVQALIKDSSIRKYIDLDNVQLPYGLDILISSGFAIDKQAILTNPITEEERV